MPALVAVSALALLPVSSGTYYWHSNLIWAGKKGKKKWAVKKARTSQFFL
jgi:hypothetical protein